MPPIIPAATKKAIRAYADYKKTPSGFVKAVLENDLEQAILVADSENLKWLKPIVLYCHWEIPALMWGSKEKVRQWLEGDIDGQEEKEK